MPGETQNKPAVSIVHTAMSTVKFLVDAHCIRRERIQMELLWPVPTKPTAENLSMIQRQSGVGKLEFLVPQGTKAMEYSDSTRNTAEVNASVFSLIWYVCKTMLAIKLCLNNILQLLSGVPADTSWSV